MSTEIIDLACKVKKAYQQNRYYDFHLEYEKLLSQYELSKKLPIDRELLNQCKNYHTLMSANPKYNLTVKYYGVIPHKPLDDGKKLFGSSDKSQAVFVPKMPPIPPQEPMKFVQQNINHHSNNMNYLFNQHAQQQQLLSTTFDKARLHS